MKEINLENILKEKNKNYKGYFSDRLKNVILIAMREACNQAIELCAENATTKIMFSDDLDLYDNYEIINKESILKIKELIK